MFLSHNCFKKIFRSAAMQHFFALFCLKNNLFSLAFFTVPIGIIQPFSCFLTAILNRTQVNKKTDTFQYRFLYKNEFLFIIRGLSERRRSLIIRADFRALL